MSTINEEVLVLRKSGGYFFLKDYSVIVVAGSDAQRFLQTRLSNDVMALAVGSGQLTALLDRKAHVIAYFSLHRLATDEFWLLMENSQVQQVLNELETYHFREQVEFAQHKDLTLLSIQSPRANALLRSLHELSSPAATGSNNPKSSSASAATAAIKNGPAVIDTDLSIGMVSLAQEQVIVLRLSLTGEAGLIFAFKTNQKAAEQLVLDQAKTLNMVPLSAESINVSRIEAGLLKFAVDFGIDELLPETGLENIAASYSKGCFQGQEVLARIRTYGATRRGLIGLIFADTLKEGLPINSICSQDGVDIGILKSNCFSPVLHRLIGLAYVNREFRVPGKELDLTINGSTCKARVVVPPFVSSRQKRERAKSIYDAGLLEFTNGSESKAAEQLRQAIELDPNFADAYEALGVILSRQDQLDEAIDLMKELERLDPDSIMAHTNLSVFYMQKGDKEAAEDEKAKAMSIRMSQITKELLTERQQEEERQKRKQEAGDRITMFRQVLDIDPDDFLANAGMGSAHVDLEAYTDAVPYLTRALLSRPNHTVAYVSLGECYEKLGQLADAIEIYKKGLSVAAQRGEITPLKDMQARLARLGVTEG